LVEALFGSFKRDYVYQACLESLEEIKRQLPGGIEHSNQKAPHSASGMRSPADFYAEWILKNKKLPVQN
jgi:putative transposase